MMSRQMDHGMGLGGVYHAVASSSIANVVGHHRGIARSADPLILGDAEIVNYDDVLAALQRAIYAGRSDESATAVTRNFPIGNTPAPLRIS